jgi:selenide,water dikinase
MTDNGRLSANLYREKVPLLEGVKELADAWIYPDNTMRNWKMYGDKVVGVEDSSLLTLSDPQTNGGLLFSVDPTKKNEIVALFEMEKIPLFEIGKFIEAEEMAIIIE